MLLSAQKAPDLCTTNQTTWHTVGHTLQAATRGFVSATGLHRSSNQTSQNHGIVRAGRDLWRVYGHITAECQLHTQQMLSLDDVHNEKCEKESMKNQYSKLGCLVQ